MTVSSETAKTDLVTWRAHGTVRRVFHRDVFTVVEGDSESIPLLVLHGFPTSSADFRRALPTLSAHRRVVLHDHLGFGLSEKPLDYSYSLIEQADVAVGVWKSLGIERGHLIAHDYGTSIATELLARRERGLLPIELASVTLSNGSIHIDLAQLTPSQRLLRTPKLGQLFAWLANATVFKAQLRRTLARPIKDEELDLMWEGVAQGNGREVLPKLISYIDERWQFRERWLGALSRLDLRSHLLWGRRDTVAVPAIAEKLSREIPSTKLTWLEDVGHYPMLEDAERWAKEALAFIELAEHEASKRA